MQARDKRINKIIKRSIAKVFDKLAMDEWITVHPNGAEHKGMHVEVTKAGTIKHGMGGKFNGMKIQDLAERSKMPHYIGERLAKNGTAAKALKSKLSDTEKAYQKLQKKFGDKDLRTKKLKRDLDNLNKRIAKLNDKSYELYNKRIASNTEFKDAVKTATANHSQLLGKIRQTVIARGGSEHLANTLEQYANHKLDKLNEVLKYPDSRRDTKDLRSYNDIMHYVDTEINRELNDNKRPLPLKQKALERRVAAEQSKVEHTGDYTQLQYLQKRLNDVNSRMKQNKGQMNLREYKHNHSQIQSPRRRHRTTG